MKRISAYTLTTIAACLSLLFLWIQNGNFVSLWMTPDQQARWQFENLKFENAMNTFEDPMWKGTASYRHGRYSEAASTFGQIPNEIGAYNMGNAFMKNFDYAKAIQSYELALQDAPDWKEAQENLRLARYTLDFIEEKREQSDTGDESELSADDFKFDNTQKKGLEMEITEEKILELETAEKWMQAVDTQTSDFLKIRFAVDKNRRENP